MKTMNFKTAAARTVAAGCLLGLTMAAQSALACTVDNWSANSGNLAPGGPAGPDTGIARYSGLCAMGTPDGEVAWVQDNSPGGINRIRARFYVLADNTEPAVIYRGFNGSSAEVFNVSLGTDGTVTLSSGGVPVSAAGAAGNWNSVEIDWDAGTGNLALAVNGGAAQTATFSNANTLASVRLGNLDGDAGSLSFDAYESRRTTEIGRLLVGDANGSGTVNIVDASAIIAELDDSPQSGQPDCNENGVVNIVDASCVITLL